MLRMNALNKSSILAHFISPAVLPAHPPISIRAKRIALEKAGHVLKSHDANPVVEIIVVTWNALWRSASETDEYIELILAVIIAVDAIITAKYIFISLFLRTPFTLRIKSR